MQNWKQYYDKTKKEYPRNNVKFLIDSINLKPINARKRYSIFNK